MQDVAWVTVGDEEDGYTAEIGPYDIDVTPLALPNQGWEYRVAVGDMISDEGAAPTLKEAQAMAVGHVRAETAELAKAFGLIEEGWIKPEYRMPPDYHDVLVWVNYGQIFGPDFPACQDASESSWDGDRWNLGSAYNPRVLYWREKPAPPTGFIEFPGCEHCQPDQAVMVIQPDEGA